MSFKGLNFSKLANGLIFYDLKGINFRFIYMYIDSSSLTNEKDHHYFLNSADVCW